MFSETCPIRPEREWQSTIESGETSFRLSRIIQIARENRNLSRSKFREKILSSDLFPRNTFERAFLKHFCRYWKSQQENASIFANQPGMNTRLVSFLTNHSIQGQIEYIESGWCPTFWVKDTDDQKKLSAGLFIPPLGLSFPDSPYIVVANNDVRAVLDHEERHYIHFLMATALTEADLFAKVWGGTHTFEFGELASPNAKESFIAFCLNRFKNELLATELFPSLSLVESSGAYDYPSKLVKSFTEFDEDTLQILSKVFDKWKREYMSVTPSLDMLLQWQEEVIKIQSWIETNEWPELMDTLYLELALSPITEWQHRLESWLLCMKSYHKTKQAKQWFVRYLNKLIKEVEMKKQSVKHHDELLHILRQCSDALTTSSQRYPTPMPHSNSLSELTTAFHTQRLQLPNLVRNHLKTIVDVSPLTQLVIYRISQILNEDFRGENLESLAI